MENKEEIWKTIEDTNNKYQVSNKGRFKSFCFKSPRILKVKKTKRYPLVTLKIKGRYTTYYIHRLLALYFIPNPNNYPMINHINGDKNDYRLENLEWVTAKQNVKHAIDTGLIIQGKDKHVSFKGTLGKFTKDGILLKTYNGVNDLLEDYPNVTSVYKVANRSITSSSTETKKYYHKTYMGHVFRRFPQTISPEIGKTYDLDSEYFFIP